MVGLATAGLGALAWLGGRSALGVRRISPSTDPIRLPDAGFDWGPWSELLAEIVDTGFVRYDLLRKREQRLEAICARLALTGPTTDPTRFAAPGHALAYHLNAYNALVLLGVLRHWPIASVGDVRGALEPVPHFGFFWGLRFRLDGRWRSLYGLEHDTLLTNEPDARVHAAINCASWSCPPLRREAFTGDRVDQQLDAATRDWVRRHGIVSADESGVLLHPLVGLYADDFAGHAQRKGWGDEPIDFFLHWLAEDEAARIRSLVDAGAPLTWPLYDWRLNDAKSRT